MLLTILSFFIVLSILVLVHEFGHLVVAKWNGVRVEEFGLGYPPRLLTITKKGGTLYTINAIPFGGFARMAGEDGRDGETDDEGSLLNKSKKARVAIMAAGPFMNLVLAVICFSLSLGLTLTGGTGVHISGVLEDSPAQVAGFEAGDWALAVDEVTLDSPEALIDYTRNHGEQPMVVRVRRGSEQLDLAVTPRYNAESEKAEIGLYLASKISWGQAIVRGAQQTVDVIWLTMSVPVLLIRGLVPLEAARPIGPIGIAQLAGGAVQQSLAGGWWFPILQLMGLLSTALAITNLLPLPALDGGRIFFVIVEAIRGKRIAPEREGMIHLIGFVLLLSLMLVITYIDIASPLPEVNWSNLF